MQSLTDSNALYRRCENFHSESACNWLVAKHEAGKYCLCCSLNEVIPNMDSRENAQRWRKLEYAKRRLIYTLKTLHLPIVTYHEDKNQGLSFRFMEDVQVVDTFSEEVVTYQKVMTGHSSGTITINILEADDSEREKMRESMNESYRTILGHFRHEIGHYYWDRMIARSSFIDEFRSIFGDERKDYEQALKKYYVKGAKANWQEHFISAYASSHPWEDWAESWAHYLHFMDVLETASHHNIGIQGDDTFNRENLHEWLSFHDFGTIATRLVRLMHILNELNRSLGFADPYPFEPSAVVIKKLEFIHRVVLEH